LDLHLPIQSVPITTTNICGVIVVSVLTSSVDYGLKPLCGQTKDYIGILS
jgi:hypothetical protein